MPAVQGHKLPEGLAATGDIQELVKRCAVILMVVPTPFVERTLAPLKDQLRPEQVGHRPLGEGTSRPCFMLPAEQLRLGLLEACLPDCGTNATQALVRAHGGKQP